MSIKEVSLKSGLSRSDVNFLLKDMLKLEDEVYLGCSYNHNWLCSCGKSFKRTFNHIKTRNSLNCGCTRYNEQEKKYIKEVEEEGNYEYIRSFRKNEIMSNGKMANQIYFKLKHKYCGEICFIPRGRFLRRNFKCPHCCNKYENSFAYYIQQELKEPLNKYWDWEKNTVNPYLIYKKENIKVWFKCCNDEINPLNGLKKMDYHGSHYKLLGSFASGHRCPYCAMKESRFVKLYDSFGYAYFDRILNWHSDNEISIFSIAPKSSKKYKFICHECGCEWFTSPQSVSNGKWCPTCNTSKGEKRVMDYLILKNIPFVYDKEYFDDLLSDKGYKLRPDFILPNLRVWIEYDGGFHYENLDGNLATTQKHDKRKNEYAKLHGYKMIRIPYWEFNNIEEILDKNINIS